MTSHHAKPYKYLMFLVAAFISCYLTQEILLNRLTSIGPGYITGGTFIYFTSPLILDIVSEVYGYKVARQLLWCGLGALLFMAFCVGIVLKMPYPTFWTVVVVSYKKALSSLVRTAVISTLTVSIGQLVNAYLISRWKILTRGKYFWLRSMGASITGDSTTVVLTTLGTFMGRIPNNMFMQNLVPELVIMVTFTAIGAIPAAFIANKLKKNEHLDNYDTNINYNPFKLI